MHRVIFIGLSLLIMACGPLEPVAQTRQNAKKVDGRLPVDKETTNPLPDDSSTLTYLSLMDANNQSLIHSVTYLDANTSNLFISWSQNSRTLFVDFERDLVTIDGQVQTCDFWKTPTPDFLEVEVFCYQAPIYSISFAVGV